MSAIQPVEASSFTSRVIENGNTRTEAKEHLAAAAEQFAVVARQLGLDDDAARSAVDHALSRVPGH